MHEASRLMLPCNLTVTQQSLQSHTWARETKVFVGVCAAVCEWGCVFMSISELEGLFPFSGLSLCQHITVHACPNQCWSHGADLTSAASPPPVLSLRQKYCSIPFISLSHTQQICYKFQKVKSRVSCSIVFWALYPFHLVVKVKR